MPQFLEAKLKSEYGQNSKIPYAVMNSKGFMHGSKETPKGRAAQAKHNRDMHSKRKTNIAEMMGHKGDDRY